jgi:DNA-binding response OmpR family regulator
MCDAEPVTMTAVAPLPEVAGGADMDAGAAGQGPGSRRARILVAEDDVEMGRLLAEVLRADGHDVVVATDGADAVSHLRGAWSCDGLCTQPFDLVVSDLRMPGWTGLEILDMLRKSAPPVPVIIITAFGSEEVHQTARRLGAVAVFDKPFDLGSLRRRIRTLRAASTEHVRAKVAG